jgi:hypothetical protein
MHCAPRSFWRPLSVHSKMDSQEVGVRRWHVKCLDFFAIPFKVVSAYCLSVMSDRCLKISLLGLALLLSDERQSSVVESNRHQSQCKLVELDLKELSHFSKPSLKLIQNSRIVANRQNRLGKQEQTTGKEKYVLRIRTENACTVSTSRCPIQSLRKLS